MAAYGRRFFAAGDRKITLNFALADGYPLRRRAAAGLHFDPAISCSRSPRSIPPCVPGRAACAPVFGAVGRDNPALVDGLRRAGYEVLVSIGEFEENAIGSNCGQFVRSYLARGQGAPLAGKLFIQPRGNPSRRVINLKAAPF